MRARAWSSNFEDDLGGAETDPIARLQGPYAVDVLAIDGDAIRGAEVLDRPAAAARTELSVAPRDSGVLEDDLAVAAASDHRPAGWHEQPAAAHGEQRARGAARVRVFDGASDAGGCAVDHRLAVFVLRGWAWAMRVAWLTLILRADQ